MPKQKTKAPKETKPKKQTPATKPVAVSSNSRRFKQPQHRSFRLSSAVKYQGPKLPSAFELFKRSYSLLWQHKKLFGGVLLIYGLMQLILVQGIISSNFSEIKGEVNDILGDQWHGLASGLTLFSYLLGSVGQTNSAEASIYQTMLLVLGSLAFIWALRQVLAGHAVRIRDAYYKGMYPLVPFILVLVVIGLQTIPMVIGAWVYGAVVANGIAASAIEHVFWLIIFALFALLSIYMICASLFALYIVTLPDMTPMRALRSARSLVLHRRWTVFRKLLFIGFVILSVAVAATLPVILFASWLAPVLFYATTVIAVGLVHAYIYNLYRELLTDE